MTAGEPTDRRRALVMLALLGVGAIVVAGLLVSLAVVDLPKVAVAVGEVFSPGLGLRGAAIIAAVVSFLVLIVFAVVSGDGLLGEIQFVIPGFFVFFLFFWVMTAWVF